MLTISSGHSADYLLDAVAAGRENYYSQAVSAGEPPGRWYGAGAEALGLAGEVDPTAMRALFEHFIDPADPGFADPSQWDTASRLGHAGRKYLNAEQLYAQAVEREPHADAERREQLRVEASHMERRNLAFLDATFSVQKSVTVVHTAFEAQEVAARNAGRHDEAQAWAAHRQAVEDAIWAGNRAALDYLAEHAGYSRVGHHGGAAGRYVDAHDWTVASFFQHDSRDHDPQLHIHNTILNRVQGPDGVWRTVDGRSLYRYRGAAAAVGERVMEEHLSHALGVRFATRPDGMAREIVGVSQRVMELFSSRRRAITPKQAELIAAFEEQFGRAPNRLQRDGLARQATFATRRAKSHTGKAREDWLVGWDAQARAEVTGGLAAVAHGVLELAARAPVVEMWSASAVLETALAAVQAKKAGWTAPDLTREISNALPDHLGLTGTGQMARLLDLLTEQGLKLAVPLDTVRPGDGQLPAVLRRADGESMYQAPGARLYATPEHVHTERLLTAQAVVGGAAAARSESAARFVDLLGEQGIELGADQRAAVIGVLTSGARIESLVGPAGTGKSVVVGKLAQAWTDPTVWGSADPAAGPAGSVAGGGVCRRVFGLATSQKAADVLTGEGVTAANTTAWLAIQQRLADGRVHEGDQAWVLRAGDLVVIDESSMAATADLAAVHARVEAAGAKMLLVGDPRQLGAVGAGGVMDLLAHTGIAYELTEARRFHQQWERAASLRLRAGDPAAVQEYHRHGRIIDAGAVEQAEHAAARRWLADTLAGKQSLLIVDSNKQAARINSDLRAELIRLGRVTETGVALGHDDTFAGVGDVVQARRNGWDLAGVHGNRRGPINRETFRVLDICPDGSIVVTPTAPDPHKPGQTADGAAAGEGTRRMRLPAGYVAQHLSLGYAVTVHAAEGVTVDTAHTIVSSVTRAQALYPAVTRGRESNTLHVVTQTAPTVDAETGEVAEAIRHDPRGIVAAILEADDVDQSALAATTASAEANVRIATAGELFADAVELVTTRRTVDHLDSLTDTGALSIRQRAMIAAEDGAVSLARVLRRVELAGHDPRAVLAQVVGQRGFDTVRGLTNVLHHRIATGWDLQPVGSTYRQWLPATGSPNWDTYLATLARTADQRRHDLGEQVLVDRPGWVLEAFGPPPTGEVARRDWVERAGVVAAHRELAGHDLPTTTTNTRTGSGTGSGDGGVIGTAPPTGQPEAYASWLAAWRALGRPEADRDELGMSDGQLRMRVRAYEREQVWAPRLVLNELAGTIQAAETHRANAVRWRAEAAAVSEAAERAELRQRAAESAALADTCEVQVAVLREVETARGRWLAHTAGTRVAADRAAAELASRRAGDKAVEPQVSAEEWLQLHTDAQAEDERDRVVTEDDLADPHNIGQLEELAGRKSLPARQDKVVAADVREVAAGEPVGAQEHIVRVPTASDTAESVRRAQRALAEITARDAADRERVEQDMARARRIEHWRSDEAQNHHDDTHSPTGSDTGAQEPA